MFGRRCEICAQKDARIQDLQAQIEMLSKLLLPPKPTQDVTLADREVDALLNGDQEAIALDDAVSREADKLLGGEYDYTDEGA